MSRPDPLLKLTDSYSIHLRADGYASKTMTAYSAAIRSFAASLAKNERHVPPEDVGRDDIESWVTGMRASGLAPASVTLHFRGLKRFFDWLVDEDEIAVSPFATLRAPTDSGCVTTDVHGAISARQFRAWRDQALRSITESTDVKPFECAALLVDDLDLERRVLVVPGRRRRVVTLTHGATVDLDNYLRARSGRPDGADAALWLGGKGPMTQHGIYQALRRLASLSAE